MKIGRRALLGSAAAVVADNAGAALFSGGPFVPPTGPTGITLNSSAPPGSATIVDNAATGTSVGTLAAIGGTAPYTFTDTDNTKFTTSGATLQRSATGTLTAGSPESVDIRVTDANSLSYTTASPFSISVTSHTGAQLTTIAFKNTSGSTTGGVTQMFGHPFKKGDIASGTAPVFKTTGGTVIPFSMSTQPTYWADGSLKHAAFMLNLAAISTTIAGNATLTVNVFSGGTVPAASARALTDFAAGGLDLNMTAVGQDNISGTWASNLNQGVTAANTDNYVWMDGAAGKVWRIRASFRQSAANHGQLEGYWFVIALSDSAGAFGGVRYLCRIAQPWYNVVSPAPQYRSFSALGVFNGASQIHDLVADMSSAKTFTWSGSGPTLNSTANGFQIGMAAYLTTTGTLPAGLSTGQMYCTGPASSPTANNLALGTDFSAVIQNGTSQCITPTNAGTGTHTITLLPMVSAYGTVWACETNGRYSFIQGGGSIAADSTLLTQPNFTYWCETKLLPPYALTTYTPASNSAVSYYCDTAGPLIRNIGQTGESEQIGPLPSYFARHVFNNTPTDEQVVRVIGLIAGHLPISQRDNTTHAIPVCNNTNYSNMPAKNQNYRWYASTSNFSGFTPPSNTLVYTQGWSYIDYSHMPQWVKYPFLLTGEPQFMDLIVEYANGAVMHQYTGTDTAVVNGTVNSMKVARNGVINGNTYAGIIGHSDDLLRGAAWPIGMLADAVGLLPNTMPENASYHQYFLDMLNATFAAYADYRAMLLASANSYVTTNGMWLEFDNADGGVQDSWTLGYYLGQLCNAFGETELTTISDHLAYCVKWALHVYTIWGSYILPSYEAMGRQNGVSCVGNGCNTLYITSDTQYAAFGWSVSWSSGTGLMTITGAPTGYTLAAGDMFMFNGTLSGTPPAGFNGNNTQYFAVNVSGATCKLSATLGGSPIAFSDSSSISSVFGIPATPPATGFVSGNTPSGSAYPENNIGHLGWVNALSVANTSACVSSVSTRFLALPGAVAAMNADPKYAIGATYV